jgi:hypothetical protein
MRPYRLNPMNSRQSVGRNWYNVSYQRSGNYKGWFPRGLGQGVMAGRLQSYVSVPLVDPMTGAAVGPYPAATVTMFPVGSPGTSSGSTPGDAIPVADWQVIAVGLGLLAVALAWGGGKP